MFEGMSMLSRIDGTGTVSPDRREEEGWLGIMDDLKARASASGREFEPQFKRIRRTGGTNQR